MAQGINLASSVVLVWSRASPLPRLLWLVLLLPTGCPSSPQCLVGIKCHCTGGHGGTTIVVSGSLYLSVWSVDLVLVEPNPKP